MIRSPVVIMTAPRSGSSMVAYIFHAHGLWVGGCGGINRFGYYSFENIDIRNKLRNLVAPDPQSIALTKQFIAPFGQDHVRRILEQIVPAHTSWVYKTLISSWCLFDNLYSDIKFVFIKRDIDAVLASHRAKKDNSDLHSYEVVRARYEFMDMLSVTRGIPYVNTDELIEGNYDSLATAFAYCDIPFEPDIANFVIKPKQWNHK